MSSPLSSPPRPLPKSKNRLDLKPCSQNLNSEQLYPLLSPLLLGQTLSKASRVYFNAAASQKRRRARNLMFFPFSPPGSFTKTCRSRTLCLRCQNHHTHPLMSLLSVLFSTKLLQNPPAHMSCRGPPKPPIYISMSSLPPLLSKTLQLYKSSRGLQKQIPLPFMSFPASLLGLYFQNVRRQVRSGRVKIRKRRKAHLLSFLLFQKESFHVFMVAVEKVDESVSQGEAWCWCWCWCGNPTIKA